MSSIHVIGITPFQRPDPRLALALERAGASGVLDLGRDRRRGLAALAELVRMRARLGACDDRGVLGVRVASGAPFQPSDLPRESGPVLLDGAGADPDPWRGPGARAVWAEVVSTAEARDAAARGYDALVAGGNERGGRVGQDSTFVLLQRLLPAVDLPVYAHGGLGPRTAAACAAGGAAGVVLDEQLALVRESRVPDALRQILAGLDGSETALVAGRRVLARPGLAPLERLAEAGPAEVDANLGGDDPARRLIPLGQAAFLARPLAEQHGSAAGVVEAVRRAVRERLELARRHDVLGPDSPLAREHGTRYPILQGPMTRVSDVAGFADDVAAGGGLPFLALALLRGKQVRELVRETAARLGERPWGIGILGFVPPELRAEQMAALEDVAPPFAIIAGGRPSQAKGLEERGTKAYLHVPSQGLLELFLKEGGRRFVFEGRECGGHVGPRGSFPLWEAQLAVLERFEKPEELSVVFAGGIHDARSAAMVAALAAKLAARGAKVGVLMGTAYLFTREAVSSGAILPAYQRMALECRETALLETAPGHATRCVETEFVRAFAAEKLRLEDRGLESRAVWAELEQLNLGRLRLASKGKRRDGAQLVDITFLNFI
jgi:NAD(P)H-dependent flavin oxidoreductase YrpB (nitropropane dioxygenase family)